MARWIRQRLKTQVYRQLTSGSAAPVQSGTMSRHEEIRRILENTPCFGNDIDDVDLVARKCALIYCQEVEKYTNPRGGQFQAGIYPVSANVLFGKDVAALPDGRLRRSVGRIGVSLHVQGKGTPLAQCPTADQLSCQTGSLYRLQRYAL